MDSLEVKDLSFEISDLKIIENLNLKVQKNLITGLVGTSGSGKTTLFHLLLGLLKPSKGEILIEGVKRNSIPKNKIQAIFQDPIQYLNPNFTLKEVLSEPIEIHYPKKVNEKFLDILTYLNYFGFEKSSLNQNIRSFSGGEIQRISFIRILLIEPEWILMDEPISGLDPIRRKETIELIKKIHIEKKISFFIISHDLDFITEISDKILVFSRGKIIEEGKKNLFSNPKTNFTKELIHSRNLTELKKD